MFPLLITITLLLLMLASALLYCYRQPQPFRQLLDERFGTLIVLLFVAGCFFLILLRTGDRWHERYEKDLATFVNGAAKLKIADEKQLCESIQKDRCVSEWTRSHFTGEGNNKIFLEAYGLVREDFSALKRLYQEREGQLNKEKVGISKVQSVAVSGEERWYDQIVALFSGRAREELRQKRLTKELGGLEQVYDKRLAWLQERYGKAIGNISTKLDDSRNQIKVGNWASSYILLSDAASLNRNLQKHFIASENHPKKAWMNSIAVSWGIPVFVLFCFIIQILLSRTLVNSSAATRLLYPGFVLFSGLGLCLLTDLSLNYIPKLRYLYLDSWFFVVSAHLLFMLTALITSSTGFRRAANYVLERKPIASLIYIFILLAGAAVCIYLPSYISSEVVKLLLLIYLAWFSMRHGEYIAERGKTAIGLVTMLDRKWLVKNFTAMCVVLVVVISSVVLKHDFGPLLLMLLLIGLMVWMVLGPVPSAFIAFGTAVMILITYTFRGTLSKFSMTAHIFDRFTEMASPFTEGTGESARLILLRHAAGPFGFDLGGIPYWGFAKVSINSPVTPAQIQSDYTASHIVAQFGYVGGGILLAVFIVWLFSLLLMPVLSMPERNSKPGENAYCDSFLSWFTILGLLLLILQLLLTFSGNFCIFPLSGVTMPLVSFGKAALFISSIILGVAYGLVSAKANAGKTAANNSLTDERIISKRIGMLKGTLCILIISVLAIAVWRDTTFEKNRVISSEKQRYLLGYAVSSLRISSMSDPLPHDYASLPTFKAIAGSDHRKAILYRSLAKLDQALEKMRLEGYLQNRYHLDLTKFHKLISQDTQASGSLYDKSIQSLQLLRREGQLDNLDWREKRRNIEEDKVAVEVATIAPENNIYNNPWGSIKGSLLFASPKSDGSLLRSRTDIPGISRPSKLMVSQLNQDDYPGFSLTGLDFLLLRDLSALLDYDKSKGLVRTENKVTIGGRKFSAGYDIQLTIDVALQQKVLAILKDELRAARLESASIALLDAQNGELLAAAAASSNGVFVNSNGIPLVFQEVQPASTSKLVFAAAILENYEKLTAKDSRLKKHLESFRLNLKDSITPYFYQLALDYRLAPLFRDQAKIMGWNSDCPGLCAGGFPDYLFGLQETKVKERKYPIAGRLFVKDVKNNAFALIDDAELAILPTSAELENAIKQKITSRNFDAGKLVRSAVAGQGTNRTSIWGELMLMSQIVAAADGRENFPLPHMVKRVFDVKGEEIPFARPESVKPGISTKSAATLVNYLTDVNISGTGHKAGFEQVFGRKSRANEMFIGKTGTTDTESDGSARAYNLYVGAFSSKPDGKKFDRVLVAIIERDKNRPKLRVNSAATIAFRLVKEIREEKARVSNTVP